MTKQFSNSTDIISVECEGITIITDSQEKINVYPDTDGSIEIDTNKESFKIKMKLSSIPVYPEYAELVNEETKVKSKLFRTYGDLSGGVYVELLMGSQVETKDDKGIITYKVVFSHIRDWDSSYPTETIHN